MKDKMTYHTEGTEKADELANMGAYLDKARRTDRLASEMQEVRET